MDNSRPGRASVEVLGQLQPAFLEVADLGLLGLDLGPDPDDAEGQAAAQELIAVMRIALAVLQH